MQDVMNAGKSWRGMRRAMGEYNAQFTADMQADDATGDYFDLRRPRLPYPQDLYKDPHPVHHDPYDPYKHLGLIGYTRNTYQFSGPTKDEVNQYGGQHMKKTLWLEEMRRRIIANREGISSDVDKTSIAGTGGAFYLNTREKKNKYLTSAVSPVPPVWNSRPAKESSSLGVKPSKT